MAFSPSADTLVAKAQSLTDLVAAAREADPVMILAGQNPASIPMPCPAAPRQPCHAAPSPALPRRGSPGRGAYA